MFAFDHLAPLIRDGYELGEAEAKDAPEIAQLNREVRFATDMPYLPDYTLAAIREGYFDKYWDSYFSTPSVNREDRVIKVVAYGQMVAFARCGVIRAPFEIPRQYSGNKWGELHQIYVSPEYQGQGLGGCLFREAAAKLLGWKCKHMLINVLEANHKARGFYKHYDAIPIAFTVERNCRDGAIYKVPCALYRAALDA